MMTRKRTHVLATAAALAAASMLAGCSVVSPPPMRMLHESVLRTDPGAVSIAAVGGGGAGIFLDDAAGGEARVSVQATREMDFELSGGAGGRSGDQHDDTAGVPNVIGWGRAGGRYRPDRIDWFALRFGVGGGAADTGLSYFTTDVGVSFGHSFLGRVRPYGGLSLAASIPVDRGPWVEEEHDGNMVPKRPDATIWFGGSAGVSVRVVGNLELGVEGFTDLGWAPNGESATAFGGTGVIRYTFGPVRKSREAARDEARRERLVDQGFPRIDRAVSGSPDVASIAAPPARPEPER